jgi:serine protease Do
VTMGIVSATGRGNLGIEDYEDFIQTDASINPGNSGGALVNDSGELIGINTAILSGGSGGNQGIGFAIPVNMARQVLDQILKYGKVSRGYLGVWIQPVTPAIAKTFGLSNPQGALIGDVDPNGPAGESGLKRGDIVLSIDGKPVSSSRELRLKVAMTKPGTTVKLKVFHNGADREVSVKLGELPAEATSVEKQGPASNPVLQGLTVETLTPDIAGVRPGSAAVEAGLRPGDVIQEINHKPVRTVKDFTADVNRLGNQSVLLLINRGGNTLYVVLGSG